MWSIRNTKEISCKNVWRYKYTALPPNSRISFPAISQSIVLFQCTENHAPCKDEWKKNIASYSALISRLFCPSPPRKTTTTTTALSLYPQSLQRFDVSIYQDKEFAINRLLASKLTSCYSNAHAMRVLYENMECASHPLNILWNRCQHEKVKKQRSQNKSFNRL